MRGKADLCPARPAANICKNFVVFYKMETAIHLPGPGVNFMNPIDDVCNTKFWHSNANFQVTITLNEFGIENTKKWLLFTDIGILNAKKSILKAHVWHFKCQNWCLKCQK